ncbi:hypothetical protein Mal33_48970 [Rosistilla oblonga]|uniref:Uncharacterized protein n=1 Tax=Rosistilla oblonga TaxID=2527990 RepID=A0A518J0L4_9BACT|nr:hypothetical protein Mal33_48970 [Rosistilla oblonga]
MSQTRLFVFLLTLFAALPALHAGSPTGWSPVILPTGAYRSHIKAMPIQHRPGRPLHIYGNTVRMLEQSRHSQGFHHPVRQIVFGDPDRVGIPARR